MRKYLVEMQCLVCNNMAQPNQRSEARNPEGTDFTCETNPEGTTSSALNQIQGLIGWGTLTFRKVKLHAKG